MYLDADDSKVYDFDIGSESEIRAVSMSLLSAISLAGWIIIMLNIVLNVGMWFMEIS